MPNSEIRMVQGLLAGDPLCGIKVEKLRKQIYSQGVRAGEQRLEWNSWFDGKRANVILGLFEHKEEML